MIEKEINRRLTKQKSAILDYLKSVKTHPDAETVYEAIKEKNPRLSLSTVYRNLSLMSDEGLILKLSACGKSDRFDGDISPHQHFICNECGKVIDVDCKADLKSFGKIKNSDFGEIFSFCVYFYGLCKECKCQKNFKI